MAQIEIIPESIKLMKMSDEEYFSSSYSNYISNSKLSLIDPTEDGSPEKYKAGFTGSSSASFELGSAVHAIVLQEDLHIISDIYKPSAKLGVFVEHVYEYRRKGNTINDSIIKASKSADYYYDKLSANKISNAIKLSLPFYLKRMKVEELPDKKIIYLSEAMSDKFKACMKGVNENKDIQKILYPTGLLQTPDVYNEYAIFVDIIVTFDSGLVKKLKLKGKIDNFTVCHETETITLNDLKTTGKPVKYFMGNKAILRDENDQCYTKWIDGSFQKFHYARQMGLYAWLVSCAMKSKGLNYKMKANMLVVETIPEFKSKVFPVGGIQVNRGLAEFKKLLLLVAENE